MNQMMHLIYLERPKVDTESLAREGRKRRKERQFNVGNA